MFLWEQVQSVDRLGNTGATVTALIKFDRKGGGESSMAIGWSKIRYSPIGIDFGADSLKLMQVIASDPPQLIAAAATDLPEETRNDPAARRAFFSANLKQLLGTQPFKGKRAICSIPAYQTLVQHLQIARVEGEDFNSQVEVNLRERLNVNPSRMVIRNFKVGEVARDGAVKHEVICMAVSRDAALRHIEIAHRAKLDVVGMHCEPIAILKAFDHLFRQADDLQRTVCFIDIGAATTKVMVVHGGQMFFCKTIHAAGNHFTRQLAQQQQISFDAARDARIKRSTRQGAPDPPEPVATGHVATASQQGPPPQTQGPAQPDAASEPGTSPQDQIPAVATEDGSFAHKEDHTSPAPAALDCLIDELKLCMRYFRSTFPEQKIEKLVFLGGESRNIATCQAIAKSLRIAAQLGDPLARLVKITQADPSNGVDLGQPQPGWAVPLGLCLCEANL